MKKVAIIGVGLIGGSLGKALKEKKLVKEVIGIGRNELHLKKALKEKAVDKITFDYKEVKNADLIALCLPIQQIIEFGKKILPYLQKSAIVIDVGSTKKEIVSFFSRKNVCFVGCHPMAGSEKVGVENAKADLFNHQPCIITPIKTTNQKSLKIIKKLWEQLGADVILLTPFIHDYLVGAISHLPHIVATTLVNVVKDISTQEIKKIIGKGFIDTTRIASSSSILWTDICFSNKKQILKLIDLMILKLNEIKEFIENENYEKLKIQFEKAKNFREDILKKDEV